MTSFDDAVVLITGAARGQGRNHAVEFARRGARIIAIDACAQLDTVTYPMSTPDDLDETVRLVEQEGGKIEPFVADVRDYEQLDAAITTGVQRLGGLDIVVANAGVVSVAPTLQLEPQAWRDVIDTNLSGVWYTVKVAAPHIIESRDNGAIVVIGSTSSVKAVNGLAHYTAAKHGLVGLTETFAIEFAEHGIRSNLVLPTNTDTPMLVNDTVLKLFLPHIDKPTRQDATAEGSGFRAATQLGVPWVDPADITEAVLFLASSAARHITGITLPVDAGYLLK